MKKNIKFGITMVAIFIWCGMMYPELVFKENVICVLSEDGSKSIPSAAETCRQFLKSGPEQIEIKSRVLEWLADFE